MGVGHGFFPDVVAALEAVVRAPWHAGHSIGGLHLLQVAARRLASSSPEVGFVINLILWVLWRGLQLFGSRQQPRGGAGVTAAAAAESRGARRCGNLESTWCCSLEALGLHHLRAVSGTGCSCCGWLHAACWCEMPVGVLQDADWKPRLH